MDIAVMFGEIGYISHKNMMDGILALAVKRGVNVFLFTTEGWKNCRNTYFEEGEYNIYNLPDLNRFDGLIIDLDSIRNDKARNSLIQRVKNSNIPCVSINYPIKGDKITTISLENRTGIYNIVKHLVKEHNAKEFFYVSGPLNSSDAIERKEAFLEALKDNGIDFDQENIFYGDFQYLSGQKAIEYLLTNKRFLPDAIVAANDFMAIGVMNGLKKAGLRVPQDVIVTGYDNCAMAELIHPRLTTVARDVFKAGKDAFRLLDKTIKEQKKQKPIILMGENVYGASCGCPACKKKHKLGIINELTEEKVYMENHLEILKSTTIDFSNITSFSEFSMKLQRYVEEYNFDYFYLCLCGDRDKYFSEIDSIASGKELERDIGRYTKYGTIPLAYERGRWTSYMEFSLNQILPEECRKTGEYYLVVPLHYGNVCMGYCVIGILRETRKQRFIPHFIIDINNALGNIRENDIKNTMFARINERWIYDELTGIYNRAGLWQKLEPYIAKIHSDNRKLAVFFIDLDGLKKVNDEFGHEEGDIYIKSMADILLHGSADDDIVARYGGDEYIMISSYEKEKDIEDSIQRIEDAIDRFNKSDAYHRLSASIGYQKEEDFESLDIRKMIAFADKDMYANKRRKKKKAQK